jgi:hypothetical protein
MSFGNPRVLNSGLLPTEFSAPLSGTASQEISEKTGIFEKVLDI